jgi:hypothetical protein
MRNILWIGILVVASGPLAAQTNSFSNHRASKSVLEGRPTTVRVAQHVTTTIRLPEPVRSVVLGDSNAFQAEYSPNEPLLVFVRPTASAQAQTNLVISTVYGRQFILLLKSLGTSANEIETAVDLLVTGKAAELHFIEDAFPSSVISETVALNRASGARPRPETNKTIVQSESESGSRLDEILKRQRQAKMERLYGEGIRVGIAAVSEDGQRLIVPFSVLSSKSKPAELVPPQVQLSGPTKPGVLRHHRSAVAEQLPVETYQMTGRRLDPGGRIDGVVIFERPRVKQSTEELLLEIADSAAIDQPTLAPIPFRPTKRLEENHE